MPARISTTTLLGVFVLPAVVFGLLYFPIVTQLTRGLVSPYAKADVRRRLFAAALDGLLAVTTCLLYWNSGVVLYLAAGAAYLLLRDAIRGQSIGKLFFGLVVISLETGRVSSLAGSVRRNLLLLLPGANIARDFPRGGNCHTRFPGTAIGRPTGADTSCRRLGSEGSRQVISRLAHGPWYRGRPRRRKARPCSGANPAIMTDRSQPRSLTHYRIISRLGAEWIGHFSSTHVVMQRMFCTFVVLRGSASLPPSVDVQLRSVRSSTTKRSVPSGNRMRPTLAGR